MGVQFEDGGPPVSEADIVAFENRHCLVLPPAYRNFLLSTNGGHPVPDEIDIVIEGASLRWRLHYFAGLNDPVESCNLDWLMEVTRETRPKYMVPIVGDEAGNHFYLDARPAHVGAIYFGPTPENAGPIMFTLVRPNFDSFIRSLA